MRGVRLLKYGVAAPILATAIRHTSWFSGHCGQPPASINFAGGGDFRTVGDAQADFLVKRAGLSYEDKVLDIGSGIGRLASALQRRDLASSYTGLEIVRYGVEWCEKQFRGDARYRFSYANVRNSFYNPFGKSSPKDFRFPFEDSSFDLVFATSVFSHLLGATTQNYFSEIARVLAPGGRLYMTCFLHKPTSQTAAFSFEFPHGDAWIESQAEPELAVAFPLPTLETWGNEVGLEKQSLWRGSWSSQDGEDFQDALLLRKAG